MKKLIFLFVFILVLFSIAIVIAEDNLTTSGENSQDTASVSNAVSASDSSGNVVTETPSNQETSGNNDVGQKTEEQVTLKTEAGMTPDNPVYFVKDIYQRLTVGNNPEKALNYKEQKIAEAEAMVEKGKPAQAEKVLDRALQYSDIVEKEAGPQMKDKVQESRAAVENSINSMEEKTNGDEWKDVNQKFDETLKKEKEVGTATELAAKINELCASLAKLDPLQYADTCKPQGNSPKWMKEQDKQLSIEQEKQAKVFFEKLSQCFESPENCDCKGMGVQKFEDFCLEKSKVAVKCKQGDESACKEFQSGSDPTDLLPDYLVPVLNQVQGKYMKAQYDMYIPDECAKQGAKTPEDCSKIMFKLNAPKECLDAGLTGQSKEDEIKCEKIMFEKNAPKECLDAGITSSESDAPRKCAKIMFTQRAPQACIKAGITGENRDDESKCRQLMQQSGNQENNNYAQKFNRDCNKIQDSTEKMKCYEEFYNNAQVQFKEDFVQRDITDQRTGEVITPEEENARKQCRNKGMDTILEYENGKRIIICVNKNQAGGNGGRCQSQDETEKLKQDCKSRGQDAQVENRGGCPWVICIGGETMRTYAPGTGPNQLQQTQNRVEQPSQNTGGIKCPDGVCDSYEKMNPWACPEDCGGTRQSAPNKPEVYQSPQQTDQYQGNVCAGAGQAPNCVNGAPQCQSGNWVCPSAPQQETTQQPNQQFCSGQAPSCAPNGAPYCENGNWVCPPAPQQTPTPMQTPTTPETTPASSPAPSPESTPAPVTGAITGRVIVSEYGDENTRSGDGFLDYWFKR